MGRQQRDKQNKADKTNKTDQPGKPGDSENFFNPFAAIGKNLKTNEKQEKPAAGAKQTASRPSAPQTGKSETAAPEDTDAELFFNAVSSSSFKPLQKESASGRAFESALRQPDNKKEIALAGPEQTRQIQPGLKQHVPAQPAPKQFGSDQSDPDQPGEDADFFARAMQGVTPVEAKGRETPRTPSLADAQRKLAADLNRSYLEDFLQGKIEFSLEYTEEFFEGHVMGLDPLILSKLRAGRYSPESHIDLHGQNAEQAYAALVEFIRHSYNKGQRALVVVTGRGKNSPGGFAVLRQNIQNWLTRDPLKRVVLAFCTAQPKDGGAGAIYVLLRKLKKSSGKIRWDIVAGDGAGFDL
ncbi:MAG: Smr/MutS family protein [Deltaproteobacteria bacterium]|jgi:DNA-nicking Smr family endonuclease|nr:Smr/MutS family protein [Deltaproteobacteria bacterium]